LVVTKAEGYVVVVAEVVSVETVCVETASVEAETKNA
jgi:hypothetical protein